MTVLAPSISSQTRARRAALAASTAITTLAWCAAAQALPIVGGAGGVVGGSATINTTGGLNPTETITQTTQRALIQWQSFNIANGETVNFQQPNASSITFNVVPLSPGGETMINGALNANGGVWLYSPNGVIIGGTARINTGSFLVTTGTTDYTLFTDFGAGNEPIPTALNGNLIQIFGATGSIDVQSGAQINAGNNPAAGDVTGFVVLNSEAITQNGTVTATDGVGYAVGNAANVSFNEAEENSGLQLAGIDVSGSNPGEPALVHNGTTTGLWVGVYAPNTSQEGFTGVINMGGTTEATGVAPSGAEDTAVLLVGSDVGAQGFNNSDVDVNTTNGQITADTAGISVNSGQAELGNMTAAGDITVETGGSPGNAIGGNIEVEPFATVSAAGQVYLASQQGTVQLDFLSTVQSDSTGENGTPVYIEGASVNADSSSIVFAGPNSTTPTGDVDIFADGGDLVAGQITGQNVYLRARGAGFTGQEGPPDGDNEEDDSGGNLFLTGNIEGDSSVIGISDFGNITVNPFVTVQSGGSGSTGVNLNAANEYNADPTSLIEGGGGPGEFPTTVNITSGGDMFVGQVQGGTVSLNSTGGNLTINGTVNASNSVTVNAGSGTIDVEANVIAVGSVSMNAGGDVDVGTGPNAGSNPPPILIQAASGGEGLGAGIQITAGGVFNAAPNSELRAGADASDPADPVSVEADGGNLTTGMIEGTDVELTTDSDLIINGAIYGSNSVTFDPLNIFINANVTSGGPLDITADDDITIGPNVTVQSAGNMTVEAGDTFSEDLSSQIVAGSDPDSPTGTVSITTDTGNLTAGKVSGTTVTLTAGSDCDEDCDDGGANMSLTGAVLGTASVSATAKFGNIDVEANVTSGGKVTMDAGDDVDVGLTTKNVLIESDSGGEGGGITITAGGAFDAASSSELRGGADPSDPNDPVSVEADDGDLTTGVVNGTVVTLSTDNTLTIGGPVFGSQAVNLDAVEEDGFGPDTININANLTSGGSLDVFADTAINVAGGVIVQSNGDLDIEADTIDAQPTSQLNAGADPSNPVGEVNVTADTGDLTLGQVNGTDVTLVSGSSGGDCGDDCENLGGDVRLNGAILGTASVTVFAYNGTIDVEANVISGGQIVMEAADDIDVGTANPGSGILIESDSGGDGNGDIELTAFGGAYDADASSELRAGPDPLNPSDAVTVVADGGDLTTGQIEGTDVTLTTDNDLFVEGAVFGSNSVTFDPVNITIDADVTSGGPLDISADNDITIGGDVTVQSAGDMTIVAGDSITADPSSLISAGGDPANPTGKVTITAEDGDLSLGQVSGTVVVLTDGKAPSKGCEEDCETTGGDVTLNGAVLGTSSVTVTAANGLIDIEANVTSDGPITATASGDIDVGTANPGSGVIVQSDAGGGGNGDIELTAGGTYDADASSELRGGEDPLNPEDAVTVIASGGDLTSGAVEGTDVTLTTDGDLTINGAIYGSNSVTFDPANVFINANVTSGGVLDITATNTITVSPGIFVRSDANGSGTGNLTLTAATITADPTSNLIAGPNSISPPTAKVTITTTDGDMSLGEVNGTVVDLDSSGALTLAGAVLGVTSVTTTSDSNTDIESSVLGEGFVDVSAGGNVTLASGAGVTSGGNIDITGVDVTLASNATVNSDVKGANPSTSGISIDAHDNYLAAGSSLVVGGASPTAPTAAVTIVAGDNGETGGNLTAGPTDGLTVNLTVTGSTAEESSTGNLNIDGAVFGVQGVFAYSDPGDSGVTSGSTTVSANVTSNGIIDIRSEGAGALTMNTADSDGGAAVTSSGGEVYLYSNHALTVDGGVAVTGVSLDATAQGALTINSGASIATTGSTTAPTWPIVPATVVPGSGHAAPTVTSLNLAADTLTINGQVTSGKAGARDDIYITALGAPTLVTVGGASGPAGFDLTQTSFGNLTGRNVVVMAGGGEGATHNANIQLASLTIDPSQISGVWLGTDSTHTIQVTGAVVGGGVNLELGFAGNEPGSGNGSTLAGYIPGEIDITGSLGTAADPMGSVGLLARNNIFMGTSAFITAAQGSSTFDAVTQSKNFSGLAQGYVFIAAGSLQMGAEGRIIQQNTSTLTGPTQDDFTGLVIGAPTATDPLIAAPSALTGKTLGAEGWAANYAAGPTAIDVFGLLSQPGGSVVFGVDAALQANLLASSIHTSNAYRINSCIFGTDCANPTQTGGGGTNPDPNLIDPLRFENPPDPTNPDPSDPNSAFVTTPVGSFFANLTLPDIFDSDTLKTGTPVTQSGNGDLWNGPSASDCPPGSDATKCPAK